MNFRATQILRSNYDGNYEYCIRELTNTVEKLCNIVERQQEDITKLKEEIKCLKTK